MAKAIFRFYEELNDFLPEHRRKKDFEYEFQGRRSVKEMVEAFDVPHSEIDLILVNGRPAGFDRIIRDGDRISVYPVFETFNIADVARLRKAPLRKTRFIADKNLAGVTTCLRRLGFDVYFHPALTKREMIEISNRQKRIILTQSRRLLKSGEAARAMMVASGTAEQQLKKIFEYLDIKDHGNGSQT